MLKVAHRIYDGLNPAAQRALDERASAATARNQNATADDIEHVKMELCLLGQRNSIEQQARGKPRNLSESRLDDRSMQQLLGYFQSGELTPEMACEMQRKHAVAPTALRADEYNDLAEYVVVTAPKPDPPHWLKMLCW